MFKRRNSSNLQGSRVLSAATTVRVRSYSDESIRDHRITGGSYDGPGKTTVTVLNQGRKEEERILSLILSRFWSLALSLVLKKLHRVTVGLRLG